MAAAPILIAYGSARGTSTKISKRIGAGLRIEAVALNDITEAQLAQAKIAIFVAATTGNGQNPTNCDEFMSRLEASSVDLSGLRYALLGLGSTNFEFFCRTGKTLNALLEGKHATPLIPYSESDKATEDLGESVIEKFVADVLVAVRGSGQEGSASDTVFTPVESAEDLPPRGFEFVPVHSVTRMSSGTYVPALWRIKFGVPSGVRYAAGGHILILPENHKNVVAEVLRKLGLPPAFSVVDPTGETLIPEKVTTEQLFSRYIDLACRVPAKLAALLGVSEVKSGSVGEFLLKEVDHFPDAGVLLNALPKIAPRTYSLSSEREEFADILVGDRLMPDGTPGLASRFLSDPETVRLAVKFINGIFTYPTDPATPIVITALGTGISPVFSILDHRSKGGKFGKCILMYGLRFEAAGHQVIQELQEMKKNGVIDELFLCISREGDKLHIGDAMKQNAQLFWDVWSDPKTEAFYCGPPGGFESFKEAMLDVSVSVGKLDKESALSMFEKRKANVEAF